VVVADSPRDRLSSSPETEDPWAIACGDDLARVSDRDGQESMLNDCLVNAFVHLCSAFRDDMEALPSTIPCGPSAELLFDRHDICDCRIVVPLHLGNHWALAVLKVRERRSIVMDSLKGDSVNKAVVPILCDVASRFLPTPYDDFDSWQVQQVQCPQQRDGVSCGLYVCVFALFQAADLDLPQSLDPPLWRNVLHAIAGIMP